MKTSKSNFFKKYPTPALTLSLSLAALLSSLIFASASNAHLQNGAVAAELYQYVTTKMKFTAIPGGKFQMGQNGAKGDDYQHWVKVDAFEMQTTEVTQKQYFNITGSNPSKFKTKTDCPSEYQEVKGVEMCPNHPVESINWNQAAAFAAKVTRTQNDGYTYRLPREAEWEYAARGGGGRVTSYGFGENASQLSDYAWFEHNSSSQSHAVAGKKPNAFGLYDMHGNVEEWMHDGYDDYTSIQPLYRWFHGGMHVNPIGNYYHYLSHVVRGGNWRANAWECQTALRGFNNHSSWDNYSYLGFRLVRTRN